MDAHEGALLHAPVSLGIVLLLAAVNAVTLQLATVIILPIATLYLFILYRYLQEIPQDKTPAL